MVSHGILWVSMGLARKYLGLQGYVHCLFSLRDARSPAKLGNIISRYEAGVTVLYRREGAVRRSGRGDFGAGQITPPPCGEGKG